jgi:hypothetical protein
VYQVRTLCAYNGSTNFVNAVYTCFFKVEKKTPFCENGGIALGLKSLAILVPKLVGVSASEFFNNLIFELTND